MWDSSIEKYILIKLKKKKEKELDLDLNESELHQGFWELTR